MKKFLAGACAATLFVLAGSVLASGESKAQSCQTLGNSTICENGARAELLREKPLVRDSAATNKRVNSLNAFADTPQTRRPDALTGMDKPNPAAVFGGLPTCNNLLGTPCQ